MPEIYKIVNQVNGKIYVGQTKSNKETRLYSHLKQTRDGSKLPIYCAIRKYGKENFLIETIEYCEESQLNEKEEYWIKELNTLCHDGYNIRSGGRGKQPEDLKLRIRESLKSRRKPVIQFNPETGEIINEFVSLNETGRQLGIAVPNLEKCTKNYTKKTNDGFGFIYKKDYEKLIDKSELIMDGYRKIGRRGKAVFGIDKKGNKIEFDFMDNAAKHIGCQYATIIDHIKNGIRYKGYIWNYKKDENSDECKIKMHEALENEEPPILQFNPKTGKIINEFDDRIDAGKKLGIRCGLIHLCTKDYINKTTHGFGFIYKDDYEKLIDKSKLIMEGFGQFGNRGKGVYGIDSNGNKIEFNFVQDAAKFLNYTHTAIINSIKRGKSCKGYNWHYKENEVNNGR